MEQLSKEIEEASRSLVRRCKCGSKCTIRYDPGCTYVICIKEKTTLKAMPDWCPKELAKKWNTG